MSAEGKFCRNQWKAGKYELQMAGFNRSSFISKCKDGWATWGDTKDWNYYLGKSIAYDPTPKPDNSDAPPENYTMFYISGAVALLILLLVIFYITKRK